MEPNKGVVSIWNKDTAKWITPDTEVFTIRLMEEPFQKDGLLFDYAYTTKEAMNKYCFWVSTKMDVKIETMLFADYLDLHLKECSPMNPFWGVGRTEFVIDYSLLNKK